MPVLAAIESALNKDYLLEREKADHYFAFDTKELDKGDIAGRYAAYTQAVKAGWISKNEIRYKEDLEPIEGLDVVTMSLGQVLFDIKKGVFFTPNMDAVNDLEGIGSEQTVDQEKRHLRDTYEWQKKRREIKKRDGGMCRVCLAEGKENRAGVQAHHITPIEEDRKRAFDDDNIITLCPKHHKMAENGEIKRSYLRELARRAAKGKEK